MTPGLIPAIIAMLVFTASVIIVIIEIWMAIKEWRSKR
jgi:hypothetical protein